MLSRDEIHKVIQQVTDVLSAVDLAVLFAFGWLLVPYTRIIYDFVNTKTVVPTKEEKDTTDTSTEENEENHFESTYLFFVVDHLKQIARLALLVYACDCVVSVCCLILYLFLSWKGGMNNILSQCALQIIGCSS